MAALARGCSTLGRCVGASGLSVHFRAFAPSVVHSARESRSAPPIACAHVRGSRCFSMSAQIKRLVASPSELLNRALISVNVRSRPPSTVLPPQFCNGVAARARSAALARGETPGDVTVTQPPPPGELWVSKWRIWPKLYNRMLVSRSRLARMRMLQYRRLRRRVRFEVRKIRKDPRLRKRAERLQREYVPKAFVPDDTIERAMADAGMGGRGGQAAISADAADALLEEAPDGEAKPKSLLLAERLAQVKSVKADEIGWVTPRHVQRKWLPMGHYQMPKKPGTLQPIAPPEYDPTAPPIMRRKPITNGVRHVALIDRSALYKGRSYPPLTTRQTRTGGRDINGRISVRGRGGGHRRHYRVIDFARARHPDMIGTIERIEYDPNRSAFICLVKHRVPEGRELPLADVAQPYSYILCPQGVRVDTEVMASRFQPLDILPGYAMQLRYIPQGTRIHNVELTPGARGQLVRTAGSFATVTARQNDRKMVTIRLPSRELREFDWSCMATVGTVSNPNHVHENWGKAGRSRHRGWRPRVRGVAMNPVDHPHGGGEGKTSGGRPSVSKWGKPTKCGYKTRKKTKKNPHILVRRQVAKAQQSM